MPIVMYYQVELEMCCKLILTSGKCQLHLIVCCVVFQFLFQQLGVIIAIVKQHIRNYLDDIFDLVKVMQSTLTHSVDCA